MGSRQRLLALILSWVAPLVSLSILIMKITEPSIAFNIVLAHVIAVAAASYFSYFINRLANCKEAVLFSVRIMADDPDGQRDPVCLVAMIMVIGGLCLQYYKA